MHTLVLHESWFPARQPVCLTPTTALNGQIPRDHDVYTRTSPNEMAPSLPMFPLEFQLGPGDFPITVWESPRSPPRLVHPLSDAILWKPRQHLVQGGRRV